MKDVDYDFVNDLLDSDFVTGVEVFVKDGYVSFIKKKIRKKKSKVYYKNKKKRKNGKIN